MRVLSTRQRGTYNGYFSTDEKQGLPAPVGALPPILHTLQGREYNTPSNWAEFASPLKFAPLQVRAWQRIIVKVKTEQNGHTWHTNLQPKAH